MRCVFCRNDDTKVVDTRGSEDGQAIRRRRECLECGRRFTTYEKVEQMPLVVVKTSGRRETFDSNKIVRGLVRACEKRSVPLKQLEELACDVEAELLNKMVLEVYSRDIGEMVMRRIFNLDQVAYVRFASVYRSFTDLKMFQEEIEKLGVKGENSKND